MAARSVVALVSVAEVVAGDLADHLERRGHEVGKAPIAGVVEPRADRAEAYRAAREAQRKLYEALT